MDNVELQTTIEFMLLSGIVVVVVLLVTVSFIFQSGKTANSLIQLVSNQFNMYNVNLYYSSSSSQIKGNYFQYGNFTYSTGILGIRLGKNFYKIPITSTFSNLTTGSIYVTINSSNVGGVSAGLPAFLNGNYSTLSTLVYISFSYKGTSYISYYNQTLNVYKN